MYGFLLRPRWIGFHVLVAVAIVAMVGLGLWQLRRLDERQAFNARVESRIDQPPAALDDVLAIGIAGAEWRPVRATGTYLPAEEVVVVNRSQGGRPGDMVVTPLQLADGRILLVERGFVPLATPAADVAAPPAGAVEVVGRLRESQQRRLGGLSDPATGELTELQRLDIGRVAPQLPGPAVPMYVELVTSQPAEAGPYPEPVAAPDLDEGPHLSYAVQWFIFSAGAGLGWVLAVRRSLATRRLERERAVADEPAPVS